MKPVSVEVWNCAWGEFEIPADVPRRFRKDGWFDKRFKVQRQLKQYFETMNERLRDNKPIQTWAEFISSNNA